MKLNESITKFLIVDKNDYPIGIDHTAGGYPWRPDTINGVKFWNDRVEAERYVKHFPNAGYRVVVATLSLIEVGGLMHDLGVRGNYDQMSGAEYTAALASEYGK